MKNTKIICTIGPASKSYEVLEKMVNAGMNVARVNMSHGVFEEHQEIIDTLKKLRKDLNIPLAIMIDTKGPEVRIGVFDKGSIHLNKNSTFTFTTKEVVGDALRVSVSYKNLHKDLAPGKIILLNDGLMTFKVLEIKDGDIICKCMDEGTLTDRKGMHFPKTDLNIPFLSDKDREDLAFAAKNDADFIAASFISNADNVLELREYLKSIKFEDVSIISKIENHSGIDSIDEIIEVSDGIMVARGDMGVEVDYFRLPNIQKHIVKNVTQKGKQVIIATEMLESMINNSRPTRAEVSDVANAVYDEACAVMLSGETAIGKSPVKVVKVMSNIIKNVEENINYEKRFKLRHALQKSVTDTISHSACNTALILDAKAIIVSTESGKTARMVSKFKPNTPIVTYVLSEKVYHQLSLVWGVMPINAPEVDHIEELIATSHREVKNLKGVKEGDLYVVTAGLPIGKKGSINLIQVEKV
jgi:pyruvate kinase